MKSTVRHILIAVVLCFSSNAVAEEEDDKLFDEDLDEDLNEDLEKDLEKDSDEKASEDADDSADKAASDDEASEDKTDAASGDSAEAVETLKEDGGPGRVVDEAEEMTGFELGINFSFGNKVYIARDSGASGWAWETTSVTKVAAQPGWNFGRFGLYLLLGFDYQSHKEEMEARGIQLDDYRNPEGGWGVSADDGWWEYGKVALGVFTIDIGVGFRLYLLEAIRAQSPNLYLEYDIGWRGAVVMASVDWSGEENMEYERDVSWNAAADEYAEATKERYDGLWMNLGIGGEYVFVGGFGLAGEMGLNMFINNEWLDESPFGYYDSASETWGNSGVKWTGKSTELGLYCSLGLRYHF